MPVVGGPPYSAGRCRGVGSFTSVHVHPLSALFTVHVAAPVEFTVAFCNLQYSPRVVTSPAAHDVAAVCAERRAVTPPA